MEIKFECPCCAQHLAATEEQGGQTFVCPGCNNPFRVPEAVRIPVQTTPTPPSEPTKDLRVYAILSVSLGSLAFLVMFTGRYFVAIFLAVCSVVLAHLATYHGRTLLLTKSSREAAKAGIFMGYLVLGLYAVFGTLAFFIDKTVDAARSSMAGTHTTIPSSGIRVEQILMNQLQKLLEDNKQEVFRNIHPVGTAKSLTLHDVTITAWKHGQDTNRLDDVREFTIRYTLYWEGPVTKDGFTKVSATYDTESQRYTSSQVLATNGMTNSDAGNAAVNLLGTYLQYDAQKSGAEQATRDYYNSQ